MCGFGWCVLWCVVIYLGGVGFYVGGNAAADGNVNHLKNYIFKNIDIYILSVLYILWIYCGMCVLYVYLCILLCIVFVY